MARAAYQRAALPQCDEPLEAPRRGAAAAQPPCGAHGCTACCRVTSSSSSICWRCSPSVASRSASPSCRRTCRPASAAKIERQLDRRERAARRARSRRSRRPAASAASPSSSSISFRRRTCSTCACHRQAGAARPLMPAGGRGARTARRSRGPAGRPPAAHADARAPTRSTAASGCCASSAWSFFVLVVGRALALASGLGQSHGDRRAAAGAQRRPAGAPRRDRRSHRRGAGRGPAGADGVRDPVSAEAAAARRRSSWRGALGIKKPADVEHSPSGWPTARAASRTSRARSTPAAAAKALKLKHRRRRRVRRGGARLPDADGGARRCWASPASTTRVSPAWSSSTIASSPARPAARSSCATRRAHSLRTLKSDAAATRARTCG